MTRDNITLPRAVGDEVRDLLCHADFTHFHFAAKRREMLLRAASALAALDAALAEPDVADLFAQFAAKQKPLDADMAAILHANLDSLYITEDALREGIDAQDRDLWQRRADEEFLKEYEKREPATVEQVIAAHGPLWGASASPAFFSGWRAAERHHKIITMEDGE